MELRTNLLACAAACLISVSASGQDAAATNAPPKSPPWDVSAAAGLTLTRGNSRTLLFTANVLGTKKWDEGKNELDLGVDGIYGKNEGVKNAESFHGFGQYNRLFTDRWFGYFRVDGLHDAIADIRYRFVLGPGAGYYFIKNTNTMFRGEAGVAYLDERDYNRTTRSYITLRLAERFEQKLSAAAKLWESVEFLPQVDKFSNYIINSELGVETAMSKHFSLMTYLQDTYHSQPADSRLKNDIKLVSAIKYKF